MFPKLIIFASGSKNGGGSGFQELVLHSESGSLTANIVAVVSNHANGGVKLKADQLGIPFVHFNGPYTADNYQAIIKKYDADFISLSGWLKLVTGLPEDRTFNIHPGPLPQFGSQGMYGHHVHEAVIAAFKREELTHSAVTMHFVNEEYDKGSICFEFPVPILDTDTPNTLAARVNKYEHAYQWIITEKIVTGQLKNGQMFSF